MQAAKIFRRGALTILSRFGLFFLCWLAMAGTRLDGIAFGIAAALAATFVSHRLARPQERPLRLRKLLILAPGFAWRSIKGGTDVAMRAFHPRLPLKTGWIEYPASLPAGTPRVMMAGEISLLPGTLPAGFRGDRLLIHCLDTDAPVMRQIGAEEKRFGAVVADD